MKKVVISSLESAIGLIRSYPALLSLPALQSLGPLANMKTSGTSCCNKVDMTPYRVTFENALRSLTEDQKLKMKTLLKADQVCYFVKNNRGQIEQKNF